MFYNILDKKRIELLPFLKGFKKDFYLAGGTGLAFQIGHRDSVDFDFFTDKEVDIDKLLIRLKKTFPKLSVIEKDEYTLIILKDNIKISFFYYPYKLLKKPINEENINIASIEDIACMKLSAILGRSSNKDYIDLYFILQRTTLPELLDLCKKKFPEIDRNLILRSLVYFKKMQEEKIRFRNDNYVDFEEVKDFIKEQVNDL